MSTYYNLYYLDDRIYFKNNRLGNEFMNITVLSVIWHFYVFDSIKRFKNIDLLEMHRDF